MGDRTMNYYDYNESRARNRVNRKRRLEALPLPGDDSIEVDEQPAVSLDEIRQHIRNIKESVPGTPARHHTISDGPHRHRDE